jgi:methionyl aminopeptidase
VIDEQFPEKHWLIPGVVQEYVKENSWRNNNEEMIKRDLLWNERLCSLRKAAEVHRQVRKYAQSVAKPGIKMVDLCQKIETTLRYILQKDSIEGGQAFPTGCSLNNVAAHYTPNYGDDTVLRKMVVT